MIMEKSDNRRELQQKLHFYKSLIEDFEKAKQDLNAFVVDRPNTTKSCDLPQKFQAQKTFAYPNVPNFKSKYSLNQTKRIPPASNVIMQNGRSMPYKNYNPNLKSKINFSSNTQYYAQKNKFTRNNYTSNAGFQLDAHASKCSPRAYTKISNKVTGTTGKVDLVDKKLYAKVFIPPSVGASNKNLNCDNMDQIQNIDTKVSLVKDTLLKKPSNSYSQVLNEIILLTEKLKQSAKDCKSYPTVQRSVDAKTVNPIEKRLLLHDQKASVLNASKNLKVLRNDNFSTAIKLPESSSKNHLKSVLMNKVDTKSSTSVFQHPNLHLQQSLASLPQSSIDAMKPRINSNRKIISTKYKVVNKNSPPQIKQSAYKLEKIKPVDYKSVCLQKIHKNKQHSPKLKNVLKSKYKIINKTAKNSPLLQSDSSKKNSSSYNLVNLPNIQTSSLNLGIQVSRTKSALNKAPKVKTLPGVNVTPSYKVCNLKGKTNVSVSIHNNSVKKAHILNSKYKVINKLSTPKRNIFINKSVFQFNSQKKPDIPRANTERVVPVQHTYIHKSVLLKRLYKSKSKIINKNSSPLSQTAKMIKTKYVVLNKQRSLPVAKQFLTPRPRLPKRYQTRRFYFSKPRHMKNRHYAAFHNPYLKRFPNLNRYSKTNMKVKRNSFQKRQFVHTGFAYGSKFAFGHGKTIYKNLKMTAPVSQILASRVLHRSINQVVTTRTKKNLMKINTYCLFYNRFGKCNKGVKCSFIHDPSKIAVCTRFLRGTCKSKNCPFSHEVCPGKMALCTYYLLGSCNNDKCPYRHESLSPDSEFCKEFFQGYCNKGRKCEKAHILICPHYVKGSCDKGDACLFPHPPQKAKKSIPQDVKDISHAKESEELFLENVSRYFEAFAKGSGMPSESPENCNRVVVRRSRLLPEQPSFIPLSQTNEP